MKKYLAIVFLITNISSAIAQDIVGRIIGVVSSQGLPLEYAVVTLDNGKKSVISNALGQFELNNIAYGQHKLNIQLIGYNTLVKKILLSESVMNVSIEMTSDNSLEEVVVSGSLKEVTKLESIVPIESYSKQYFRSNPNPSLFESLQNMNGVRPQMNCNICNTGDIHINGLEGPYTMVLIDGMPIVSGLATVYGLTGIPQSLVDRIEVVKGPASTLYGSEAVGGIINVITKKYEKSPKLMADVFSSNWRDVNTDLSFKASVSKKLNTLVGLNYFNYSLPKDKNKDGFTDLSLQNRISAFSKWEVLRKSNKEMSFAARYMYEDRWGGQMNWQPKYRGGDEVYGESIFTSRWELFGNYQLPTSEKIRFQFSANGHHQNSVYGTTFYKANQRITFAQLIWEKRIGIDEMTLGLTYRNTFYDDNTPATQSGDSLMITTKPSLTHLPGLFTQHEFRLSDRHKILLGMRYDFNSVHGNVFTPRFNYQYISKSKADILRLSIGNGYRVANIFTEDHAALTGARKVEFAEQLRPETSWNVNVNWVKKIYFDNGMFLGLDASTFYTYFTNRILPDYTSDANKIIYSNLSGSAVSKGISLNVEMKMPMGLKVLTGATLMDVSINESGTKSRQLLTEQFSGIWVVGYTFKKINLTIDYTGNVYGPMLLPLLSELDERPEKSPFWSLQNIQITKKMNTKVELYFGVKNILNYTPPPNSIARSFDPFDKGVLFDANGKVIATANNPQALSFDPTYMFAPNQGIRFFAGIRVAIN